MTLKPASTFLAARSPIVDQDGNATFYFSKLLQGWDTQLRNGLNAIGQLIGEINAATIIQGRTEGIGTTVGHIDDTGAALAPMIDFSRPYINKTTDHINDGTGSPLAGGVVAHQSLIASAPVAGQALVYDGTAWNPDHPSFTGLSGQIATGQLPNSGVTPGTYPLASVTFDATGRATGAAAGPVGLNVTIVTAMLTVGGTNGSMTFVGGILTALTPAT
jgi:hypothetical protein